MYECRTSSKPLTYHFTFKHIVIAVQTLVKEYIYSQTTNYYSTETNHSFLLFIYLILVNMSKNLNKNSFNSYKRFSYNRLGDEQILNRIFFIQSILRLMILLLYDFQCVKNCFFMLLLFFVVLLKNKLMVGSLNMSLLLLLLPYIESGLFFMGET